MTKHRQKCDTTSDGWVFPSDRSDLLNPFRGAWPHTPQRSLALTPDIQTLFSAVGMGVVVFGWLHYLSLIGKEKVPKHPQFSLSTMLAGSLLSIAPWMVAVAQKLPLSLLAVSFSVGAVGLALFFVYLLRQAPLPDRPLRLQVNDRFPPLQIVDANGQLHNTQDQQGQRFLFKFFRGHW